MRVKMTVGCPGAGKTTWGRDLEPRTLKLSLDEHRAAIFGLKKLYWDGINENPWRRRVLHTTWKSTLRSAIRMGLALEADGQESFDIALLNTHLFLRSFEADLTIMKDLGVTPELFVFDAPWEELLHRNAIRPAEDSQHPDDLRTYYDAFIAPDAWWRSLPHTVVPVQLLHLQD